MPGRIEPGATVSVFSFRFYQTTDEAKSALGNGWKTHQSIGEVVKAVGKGVYQVRYPDGLYQSKKTHMRFVKAKPADWKAGGGGGARQGGADTDSSSSSSSSSSEDTEDETEIERAALPTEPNKVAATYLRNDVEWKTRGARVDIRDQRAHRGKPRLHVPQSNDLKAMSKKQYFLLLFPMLTQIVDYTNERGKGQGEIWADVDVPELLRFIGVVVNKFKSKGISTREYFRADYYDGVDPGPWMHRFMSFKRFERIKKAFCISNPKITDEQKEADPWWSIRDFVNAFNKMRKEVLEAGWLLCIDESMYRNIYSLPIPTLQPHHTPRRHLIGLPCPHLPAPPPPPCCASPRASRRVHRRVSRTSTCDAADVCIPPRPPPSVRVPAGGSGQAAGSRTRATCQGSRSHWASNQRPCRACSPGSSSS